MRQKKLSKKQLAAMFAKMNARIDGYEVELGIKKAQKVPAHIIGEKPTILGYKKVEKSKTTKKSKTYGELSGEDIRKIIKEDEPLKKYQSDDFIVKLDTSLGKGNNVYNFSSKDGRIDANLFYEPKNVHVRGIIYGKSGVITKEFGYAYPFAYGGGEPDTQKYAEAIARALNRGDYKSL